MQGMGDLRDIDTYWLLGKPIDKICPCGGGTNLQLIPMVQIGHAIEQRFGTMSHSEWYPYDQAVLVWCHVQESKLEEF